MWQSDPAFLKTNDRQKPSGQKGTLLTHIPILDVRACRYAADGYARARGTLGVACVTYGVGSLSALNAVAGAYAEDIPLVLISGNPPTGVLGSNKLIHHMIGRGAFSFEVDCFKPVTCFQVKSHLHAAWWCTFTWPLTYSLHLIPVHPSIGSTGPLLSRYALMADLKTPYLHDPL